MIFMAKIKKESIFIWGAGGHGRCLLDVFKESKEFEPACFVDDKSSLKGSLIDGIEVIYSKDAITELKKRGIKKGIVGIGNIDTRCKIYETLKKQGFILVNAIDPTAIISKSAKIGQGVAIMAGSIICSRAEIADNVIVNEGAVIGHDNVLGFGSHVAGGASFMGGVKVGDKTFIGVGAVVICKSIGSNSVIGAGAVVNQDVPDNVVCVGFPARIIRKKDV